MMPDFINFSVEQEGYSDWLLRDSGLSFKLIRTRNENFIYKAKFKNMRFVVFKPSDVVEISGSIHYLANGGIHNHDDLKRLRLSAVILEFCDYFKIDPRKAVIHGFEFGVNLELAFEPSNVIRNILSYKTGKLEKLKWDVSEFDAIKISFNEYKLKIYNKSKQFGLQNNILRAEVKILSMSKISHIKKRLLLDDLASEEILSKLGRMFISVCEDLIISECMDFQLMKKSEIGKFNKMKSREYWKGITNKNQRRKAKGVFRQLTEKYGDGFRSMFLELISVKLMQLLESGEFNTIDQLDTFLPVTGRGAKVDGGKSDTFLPVTGREAKVGGGKSDAFLPMTARGAKVDRVKLDTFLPVARKETEVGGGKSDTFLPVEEQEIDSAESKLGNFLVGVKEEMRSNGLSLWTPFEDLNNSIACTRDNSLNSDHIKCMSTITKRVKCPNCKKVLINPLGNYCNQKCIMQMSKRRLRAKTKKQIERILMKPNLFELSKLIKIDYEMKEWLFKKGVNFA